MIAALERIKASPVFIRVIPFGIFLLLTFAQEWFGQTGQYWLYVAKTVVGAAMLIWMWPAVEEMRWKWSLAGVVTGVIVFFIWIGIDDCFRLLGINPGFAEIKIGGKPWNPPAQFGSGSSLAVFLIAVRIVGSSLVVPPLEEVFFRSFLYRYLVRPEFLTVPFAFFPMPFLATSIVFGFEHREWLAGVLCGFAYMGLVIWKKRLGDAITAHTVTNFLLGLWVVSRNEWKFW